MEKVQGGSCWVQRCGILGVFLWWGMVVAQDAPSAAVPRTPLRSTEAHDDLWESEPAKKGEVFRTRPKPVKNIGWRSDSTGDYLSLTVGIEQWTENKRDTHRRQVWKFYCNRPVAEKKQDRTSTCTVTRTVIDKGMLGMLPLVTEHFHSVDDETLRVGRIDWDNGAIELSIVHTNERTAEVTIRFSEKDGHYFFQEFTAATLLRELPSGKVSIIEYRIPEYTYHVNVPIEMLGLNDAGIKPWDEIFAKLSKADQAGWYALFGEKETWLKGIEDRMIKTVVGELKKRFPTMKIDEKNANTIEYTPEQKAALEEVATKFARDEFIATIQSSPRLSDNAKQLITPYIKTNFTLK